MHALKALALFLSLLAAGAAQAGGWNPLLPAPARPVGVGSSASSGASPVLLSLPFTSVGGAFSNDAGTVSNVSWNGSSIVDPYNTWTQNGTVPQVTTSPWYPQGFSAAAMAGAGGYSASNYYSLGTGLDPLDFTGDFSACLIYSRSRAANEGVFEDGNESTMGYRLQDNSGQIIFTGDGWAAAKSVSDNPGSTTGAINVVCFGRAGGSIMLKSNLRSVVTGTPTAPYAPGTENAAWLGLLAGLTGLDVTIFASWFSSTTSSDPNFTAIMSRLFGHVAATGQTLTVTRATTATAEPKAGASPSLYVYPANILRITENGALLENSATNYVLQSQALDNVAWTSTTTVTADQYAAPDGTTTAEKVASSVNTQTTQQAVTAASSTLQTASAWVRADTGTVAMTVGVDHATVTPSACTCAVSTGTCTAAISANKCFGYSTVGTTFVRLSATATYAAAQTAEIPFVTAGQYGTSTGAGGVWGVQLESGGYASSYQPTTTVAVARNTDVISVANPLPVGPFCVTGTYVPALAPLSTWASAVRDLWAFGTPNTANSSRVQIPTVGSIIFQVIDGGAASKTWTVAAGALTGSTAATITACSDNAGNGTVTLNGVGQAVTVAGAGSGVLTTLGAVSLLPTASGTFAAAAVKNFKVCKTSNPAACQ